MQPSASTAPGAYNYGYPVTVPSSIDGALVFPIDSRKGKVEYWMYNPAMTQGAISIEEVAEFLQGIDIFIKPIFKSKFMTFLKWFPLVIFLAIVGMFIFFFLCIFGLVAINIQLDFFPAMIFITMVVLVIVAATSQCVLSSYVRKRTQEAKEKIQPYIQLHNGNFQQRGYFWVAPVHFPSWIELWRESPVDGIPVMMPGVMNIQEDQGEEVYGQQRPSYGVELKSGMQKGYMEFA